MFRKYAALRLIGFDMLTSAWIALLSAALQPPDVIRVLNLEVRL